MLNLNKHKTKSKPKPTRKSKNCSCVCISLSITVVYNSYMLYTTVLIIPPPNLQMLSFGREGGGMLGQCIQFCVI